MPLITNNNKDLHLLDHFYTENACFVPPGKPVTCSGNTTNFVNFLLRLQGGHKPFSYVDISLT